MKEKKKKRKIQNFFFIETKNHLQKINNENKK